ncbi:hypothetical protein N7474_008482 [Penicillium riverlandense]|uniref:uncharacterized protein n=1 Tax=Penicillium riverlandense TaxID=1903569 RepID=UPI002549B2D1|nr:uncharacterized protein N7474_008482 [Penicillium riverlandense]KAJ5812181.1 hypothetical protein N7474_008482 [Penicillium riverlandense]
MTSQDFVSELPTELPAYYEMEPPRMISRIDTVDPWGPDAFGPYGPAEHANSPSSSSLSTSNSISNLDSRTPSFTSSCATSIPEDNPPVPSKGSSSKRSCPTSHRASKTLSPVKPGVRTIRKSCWSHMPAQRGKMKDSVAEYKWNMTGLVDQKVYSTQETVLDLRNHMREYVSTKVDAFAAGLDDKILSLDEQVFAPKSASIHNDEHSEHGKKDKAAKRSTGVSKVHLYENSRLPAVLPQFTINPFEYPLIRLAAQFSHQTYMRNEPEKHTYIPANSRQGTKAMVIGCVDDKKAIVLAIRGTASLKDWAVNMHTEPTSPEGFLDDTTNFAHGGFLGVAKKMIQPIAGQLRALIAENPSRQSYSLLITGHSAGAAVAGLLYCHMLSTKVNSELAYMGSYFKHIHCITFGAPPSAERPLHPTPSPDSEGSLFYAFINEGDPVPRADKAYLRSLLNLYTSPAPNSSKWRKYEKATKKPRSAIWEVPPAPLSLAGHLVVLRSTPTEHERPMMSKGEVEACVTSDDVVRNAIFGDPGMHMMKLYSQRIDSLKKHATW